MGGGGKTRLKKPGEEKTVLNQPYITRSLTAAKVTAASLIALNIETYSAFIHNIAHKK
jgi:hypothetical protein